MCQTERLRRAQRWLAGVAAYVLLACGLTWPLPQQFQTHFLGDTSGDVGVWVWNLWIFRHELVEHGRLPLSTDHVFTYTDGLDFALHNYTPLAGLLGVPLMDSLGIVGTFNVILIFAMVLSGLGAFLLARRLGLETIYAWSAGALFIASPVLTARGSEHFSLITAAPLPLFIWALLRALDTRRFRDAALVGVLVAVATYSDAYYGIYCAMAGLFVVGWTFVRVSRRDAANRGVWIARSLDLCIAVVAAVIAWRAISGTPVITLGTIRIGLRTLYTPVLVLTLLAVSRAWVVWRPRFALHDPGRRIPTLVSRAALAIVVCLALLTPLLAGIGYRYLEGRLPETEVYWRSSPPGVDLLAYLIPNPLHPLFGQNTRSWFGSDVMFPEFVASFSIVAFLVIAAGAAMRALPRMWIWFTVAFAMLSAGPFFQIAGVNTYVPGPWAFLRYVPILGMARSPSRFTVLTVLGLSILFAFALRVVFQRIAERSAVARLNEPSFGQARAAGVAIAVALAFELLPAPRLLYSADVPEVYKLITATSDENGRVLELPTGVRDGTSSIGKFNAANQYFQTRHHRPMVGGYVSRVSRWRVTESRRSPVLRAIFELSEGRTPPEDLTARAHDARDAFLRRTCVRFVVVNKREASLELRNFAHDVLNLTLVHEDSAYELLTPVDPPPCDPRRRKKR